MFFFLDEYISLLSQTTSVSANVTFYSRVCEWYGKWKNYVELKLIVDIFLNHRNFP